MRSLLTVVAVLVSFDAAAQSASPISPGSRAYGSMAMDRIPTPIYRSPDYSPLRDSTGRRVGTIEQNYGPLGTDFIVRDERGKPVVRVPGR